MHQDVRAAIGEGDGRVYQDKHQIVMPARPILAPEPWNNDLVGSDPDFSNCGGGDAQCRMAWFERISGCTNLFL